MANLQNHRYEPANQEDHKVDAVLTMVLIFPLMLAHALICILIFIVIGIPSALLQKMLNRLVRLEEVDDSDF